MPSSRQLRKNTPSREQTSEYSPLNVPEFLQEQTGDIEKLDDLTKIRGQGCFMIVTVVVICGLVVGMIRLIQYLEDVSREAPGILTDAPSQSNILNSAAGVSIWESTISKPRNLSSQLRNLSSQRYAVAYVWSDPDVFFTEANWTNNLSSFLVPYANGRGICALALSAIASRRLLQDSVGPGHVADAVVLSDNIASEHVAYLKGFGIRVLFSNLTDLYSWPKYDFNNPYHAHHRAAFFKMRATTLKAGLAGLTEYRSLVYLDIDAYLYASPPKPDPLEGLGRGTFEFMSKACCANAPLAVGMYALRPQQDAFRDFMQLLKTGFSPETGWGHRRLRIGPDGWPHLQCRKHFTLLHSYCKDSNTTRWDFLGAEGDKGLLFSEYAVIRHTFTRVNDREFRELLPAYNFYGKWKPWMPDNPCVDYTSKHAPHPLRHIPEYWRLYQKYSQPIMTADSSKSPLHSFCAAELDKGLKSYQDCTSAHGQSA